MTDINPAATVARETARHDSGQFGTQEHSAPDVSLNVGPKPVEKGEEIIWLIEGDDHEVKLVEATSQEEAIGKAAELFEEQYEDEGDEDEDEDREPTDVRDLLSVAGTFRGDIDGYSDELEFAPWGDLDETTALSKLEYI